MAPLGVRGKRRGSGPGLDRAELSPCLSHAGPGEKGSLWAGISSHPERGLQGSHWQSLQPWLAKPSWASEPLQASLPTVLPGPRAPCAQILAPGRSCIKTQVLQATVPGPLRGCSVAGLASPASCSQGRQVRLGWCHAACRETCPCSSPATCPLPSLCCKCRISNPAQRAGGTCSWGWGGSQSCRATG